MCYKVRQAKSDGNTIDDGFLIDNVGEELLFDDPLLKLVDWETYGCRLELNKSELEKFCLNGEWHNLMIFQNLFLLRWLGTSGVSNPHYLKDWIQVEIDNTRDRFVDIDSAQFSQNYCKVPTTRIVEIYTQRIGPLMQPQIIIKKVQVFSEEAKWTFDLQNAADRKSFFPRVIIRQIDIDRAIDPVVAT